MSAATGRAEASKSTRVPINVDQAVSSSAKEQPDFVSLSSELINAAANGDVDVVTQLLNRGAHVDTKRHDGLTPLLLAAFFGHLKVVKLLIERGANPHLTSRFGTSAAMWAKARGFPDVSQFLSGAPATRDTEFPQVLTVESDRPSFGHDEKITWVLPENDLEFDSEVTLVRSTPQPDAVAPKAASEEVRRDFADVPNQVRPIKPARPSRVLDDSWEPGPIIELSTAKHQPGAVFVERLTAHRTQMFVVLFLVMMASGVATYSILRRERKRITQGSPVVVASSSDQSKPSIGQPATEQLKTSENNYAVETSTNPQATTAINNVADGSEARTIIEAPRTDKWGNVSTRRSTTARTSVRQLSSRSRGASESARMSLAMPADTKRSEGSLPAVQSSNESRKIVTVSTPANTNQRSRDYAASPEIVSPNRKSKVIQWP